MHSQAGESESQPIQSYGAKHISFAPYLFLRPFEIEQFYKRFMNAEWRRGNYLISTDNRRLDLDMIHAFLSSTSYWAQGRSIKTVARSIEHSLNFGVYQDDAQVGFARVVTDYATFAWLADVFVLPDHRGQGLGKWLLETITSHPELQGLRRWMLATRDAQDLYRRFGFRDLGDPARWMEKFDSNA